MELRITGNQLLLSNESETMRNWIIKASKESPHLNSKMLIQFMEAEKRIMRQNNYVSLMVKAELLVLFSPL